MPAIMCIALYRSAARNSHDRAKAHACVSIADHTQSIVLAQSFNVPRSFKVYHDVTENYMKDTLKYE